MAGSAAQASFAALFEVTDRDDVGVRFVDQVVDRELLRSSAFRATCAMCRAIGAARALGVGERASGNERSSVRFRQAVPRPGSFIEFFVDSICRFRRPAQ